MVTPIKIDVILTVFLSLEHMSIKMKQIFSCHFLLVRINALLLVNKCIHTLLLSLIPDIIYNNYTIYELSKHPPAIKTVFFM